ncbi:hypothetical protein COV11_01390 [Candidatus Woesearchaeota archaeon CG10_big_fil_rev_8_21_14_0_10_30_7]|nr:MAG: hypothetical protein COV11_01390 [Candidatus Woesearchaeota archaeon CG10_big_fil_rev_8_21_14_0_10_30_7]
MLGNYTKLLRPYFEAVKVAFKEASDEFTKGDLIRDDSFQRKGSVDEGTAERSTAVFIKARTLLFLLKQEKS